MQKTDAMMHGRKWEKDVRKEVDKIKEIQINLSGLKIKPEHIIMGASLDGICNDYVIECPLSVKAATTTLKMDK